LLALPLAVPLAVCEATESLAPVRCGVKWPNDVWIDGRKLAGILLEGRPQDGWAVLGIGLNVNLQPEDLPEELRETATSIAAAAGEPRDLEDQLAALLRSLDGWIGASQEAVLAAWRRRDAIIGRQVSWDGGEGRADDLGGVEGDGHQSEGADDIVRADDRGDQGLAAGYLEGERRAGDEGDGDDVPDAHGVGEAQDAEREGADRDDGVGERAAGAVAHMAIEAVKRAGHQGEVLLGDAAVVDLGRRRLGQIAE